MYCSVPLYQHSYVGSQILFLSTLLQNRTYECSIVGWKINLYIGLELLNFPQKSLTLLTPTDLFYHQLLNLESNCKYIA